MKNIAFIDGQNLYQGAVINEWKIDYLKFRIYLKDKYKVKKAFYFIGFFKVSEKKLYENLENAGFILVFKNLDSHMKSFKKGNVDVDIVFNIMKNLLDNKGFDKVILISGDGDYFNLVNYLLDKDRFCKILFPNKKFASSLYINLGSEYFDFLESVKKIIEYK